ncbi:mitochondrial import inner membrane translocase subunit Tim23 [Octopus bimaculoides]|uniref:mitochondrial import inner membrane translocase subunit Tim23 n=1 Tax=Octopus bimaculoides TaxID=37653 RepID=UPI0022E202CE|nr:mitochondrial import inner membrane translocase subunit Tim23 [Octopus bimaculoides]
MDSGGDPSSRRTFFNPYSSSDPTMSAGVSAGGMGSVMSPYLNFDPAYIGADSGSDFIFPEGASRQRGRLELAFSQIGGSVFAGKVLDQKSQGSSTPPSSTKQHLMLNFITKQGASSAQSLGVIALMYSVIGVLLQLGRGVDDEINTLTAATSTGLLYKSSGKNNLLVPLQLDQL